jgi:hypothetical protein
MDGCKATNIRHVHELIINLVQIIEVNELAMFSKQQTTNFRGFLLKFFHHQFTFKITRLADTSQCHPLTPPIEKLRPLFLLPPACLFTGHLYEGSGPKTG